MPANLCPRCRTRPKHGNDGYCRECYNEYMREYQRKHTREAGEYERRNGWKYISAEQARKRGFEMVDMVDPMVVYQRDGGVCQRCHGPVDLALDRQVDPWGATLDHTAPVHSYETVQLAHRSCNSNAG